MTSWKSVSWTSAAFTIGALTLVACMKLASSEGWVRILDDANLIFHEAGHPIFGILGQTLGWYGGTLGQLAFPVVTSVHFWRQREPVAVTLCAAWFFENLLNIARYMADARAQILPLIGGGEHDWTEIFTRWGVLAYDTRIAGFVGLIGWVGFIACGIWLVMRARSDV
jgi:hypothetical protein